MLGQKYSVKIPDASTWMDMVSCQATCPIRTDSGRYVQLIAQGRYEEAYLTARSPNPFASVCGRICAAPCEDKCRRGRIDAPVSIRALKRFVCERHGAESLLPDTQDSLLENRSEPGNKTLWHLPVLVRSRKQVARRQKVAVIGAGPAGLACAHDLALIGYDVTIFEATALAGGMLSHGIPEFRLARPVIEKEIERIRRLGVTLEFNRPLTEAFGLAALRATGYEAVFLSVGTQRARDLAIEGSDLDGIVKAIDYLLNVNNGYRVNLGKKVMVIGGGFVAFDAARMALRTALQAGGGEEETRSPMAEALDAARAALRAGATQVRMVSLESFDEMPVMRTAQGKEEFEEALHEGILFIPQRSAKRFVGRGGCVAKVDLIGVVRTYDEHGRFNPVYDPSFTQTIETDSVILAIGQHADLSFLKPEDGIELTPQGTVKIDPSTLATTATGVFAGGDVAFGPRNMIEAVANGKRAAFSIDNYFRKDTHSVGVRFRFDEAAVWGYRMPRGYEKRPRQSPPAAPLGRRTGISEVEIGYSEEEARMQAERCVQCHVQTIYDPEVCVLCGRCVDVCPEECLRLVPFEQLDLEKTEREKLGEFYAFTDEQDGHLSAMIKDDEKCIRCGLCAIRCPTRAMTMETLSYEEYETTSRIG